MKKKLIIRIVLIVCISVIFGFGVYRLSAVGIGKNQLPMPFGFGLSVVQSGSMEPTFEVGDLIIVTQSDDFEVGDIVVFQDGRSLVVHRIVEIDGEQIITQGDANNTSDAPMTARDIKGEVKPYIPKVGYVVDVIKSGPVTVILLGLAIFLYVLSLKRVRKEDDDDKAQLQKEIEELKNQLGK